MSVDINDDSENTPIDLFAPKPSMEAYAFPVEQFHPSLKQEPLDEPASLDAEFEQNVEVNPNKPEGTLVDVVETGIIPEGISLGLENDGITDTPLEQAPESTEPVDRVSLEQELKELTELNSAYSALRFNGGISREDVARIESNYPGIITNKKPLNAFSSVVSVCGFDVSCESIGDRILDLIDRILAGIGRIIDRLINVDRVPLAGMADVLTGTTSTLESRWKNIEALAARIDSTKPPKSIGDRVPDSDAARKSATLKHFVRLYSVELIRMKTNEVVAGYNLVGSGTAYNDLVEINRNLENILTEVKRAIASGQTVHFPTVPTAEFRDRYTNKVKGAVPNIEKIILIKSPTTVVANIRKHVTTLNEIKRDVEKQRNGMIGDTNATNMLKSVVTAIVAAEAYTTKLNVCLSAYRVYENIVGMSLDQVSTKLQMFKL